MQTRKTAIGVILVTMLLAAFLLIRPVAADEPGYQNISVQQAWRMMKHNSGNLVILDVRNQCEYDLGHLYGAILIPLGELENRTRELQTHINDKIIVYCKAGSRSAPACQILAEHGFTGVYNMLGGITAWMQADYPIYTSSHYVTVDFANHGKKTLIDIEPALLYQASCTPCQSQTCLGGSTPVNTQVIEESENHTVLLVTDEINGTMSEYRVDKTSLWRYNELENGFNRTILFVSIVVTKENESTQLFGLYDYVQHSDYKLTLSTILIPLDSETYNSSFTVINYAPAGKTGILSSENVAFNTSVTLSQLYASLGKVANELRETYKKSEDANLAQFAERYATMADEFKLLYRLVETQIPEYNKNILNSKGTILDNELVCWLCSIGCQAAVLFGCFLVCVCTGGLACAFCWYAEEQLELVAEVGGCDIFCYLIGCDSWFEEPENHWVSSIAYYGSDGGGSVQNPSYLIGSPDGAFAHLHCCNYGDTAKLIGQMDTQGVHGQISIYGYSGSGYYSNLYVYVSYDYQNWYLVNSQTVTANSPYWINCGYTSICFTYIGVCGYDSANSVCLNVDAVRVTP